MGDIGIQLPAKFDLKGILSIVLQILGLTWANIRQKLVKRLGEKVVGAVEKTMDIVKRIITEGPMALWEMIKAKAAEIKNQVMEGIRSQSLPVEDTVRIFVRSATGVIGNIDLSWSLNKELDRYISIYGSRGTVLIGWKESKYRQTGSSDWVTFGTGYDKVAAFRNQIINFARAIHGEETLLINSEDAVASVEVVEAAYESLRQNHWTEIRNGASASA
jgi:hypothetical protein